MTNTLIDYDPNDTGDCSTNAWQPDNVHRFDDLGTEPTRDLAAVRAQLLAERRDTTEELTQNIGPYSEFARRNRRPAHDDTREVILVESAMMPTGAELATHRIIDMDETVIHHGPGWLAGVSATVAGELQGPQPEPPPLPKPPRPAAPGRAAFTVRGLFTQGRHRAPAPLWTRVSIAFGTALVLGSTVGLAVLATIR